MSFRDAMLEGMAEYLRSDGWGKGLDVDYVTGYEEDMPSAYYCETCGPDPVMVHIYYVDSKGKSQRYSYYGGFADFIREIT